MKVVIIGGETGGLKTAIELRRLDKDCEITIIEKLPYLAYMNYAMPYYVSGEIEEEELFLATKEELEEKYRLEIKLNTEVVEIMPEENAISIASRQQTNMYKLKYDKLIISVGTIAKKLPVFESLDENVFIHKNLINAKRLKEYIQRKQPKSCVIVGSGFIGLELAESFNMLGMDVYIIEQNDTILSGMDIEISKELENILDDYITLLKESKIESVTRDSEDSEKLNIHYIQDMSKKEITVDFAVVTAGMLPATKFVLRAGINVDENDYIIVDENMKTNYDNIYALGDAVKTYSSIYKIPMPGSSVTAASKQAHIIARDIVGDPYSYDGTTGARVIRIFGYTVGTVGLGSWYLKENNIPYYTEMVLGNTSVPVFANSEKILIKAFFSKKDKRLLGAVCMGRKDVEKKVDILSTAVTSKMTAQDLMLLELSFAPKLGVSEDVINEIGRKANEYNIEEE